MKSYRHMMRNYWHHGIALSNRAWRGVPVLLGVMGLPLSDVAVAELPSFDVREVPAQSAWQDVPEQHSATEGFVDVGGARLWYWDTGGSGETVVLLHPWTGSAAMWGYQQPAFAEAGYRVIAYSRRGHYRSEVESVDAPGTGVGDLFKLLEHLEVGKFHLVGIAAGADIVPDFAISHPDRLLSLAIGCTIGRPGDPAYTASNETLLPPEFWRLPAWLKELNPSYRDTNPSGVARWRELEANSKNQPVRVREENDVTPELIRSIDIPTLLFTGDSDLYMPPSRLRTYASYWKDPELVIFKEAGHSVYWEQPSAFNRVLLDFFQRHGG